MAVAMILDLPGVTEEQYDAAHGQLGAEPVPGNLLHLAGPIDGGWRVVEVWDSPEAMGAFFQSPKAMAAFQDAGFPQASPSVFPIKTLQTTFESSRA